MWRGAGAVERGALEMRWPARARGVESLPLRHVFQGLPQAALGKHDDPGDSNPRMDNSVRPRREAQPVAAAAATTRRARRGAPQQSLPLRHVSKGFPQGALWKHDDPGDSNPRMDNSVRPRREARPVAAIAATTRKARRAAPKQSLPLRHVSKGFPTAVPCQALPFAARGGLCPR